MIQATSTTKTLKQYNKKLQKTTQKKKFFLQKYISKKHIEANPKFSEKQKNDILRKLKILNAKIVNNRSKICQLTQRQKTTFNKKFITFPCLVCDKFLIKEKPYYFLNIEDKICLLVKFSKCKNKWDKLSMVEQEKAKERQRAYFIENKIDKFKI